MIRRLIFLSSLSVLSTVHAQIQSTDLEEVVIKSHPKIIKLNKDAIKTEVIDAKAIRQQPVDISQMLNKISGVRVRQSGGLGANYSLLLNGFQGSSIRYFKDGIPTDYMGAIFSLASIPMSAIQRVEVYKGVLPAELGADALGGAVNIVTQENTQKTFLDFSSDLGSYNTYRFALNGKWLNSEKKFYVGTTSFYNHSDNNYKVTIPIVDTLTSNFRMEERRLFHNQFSNYYTEIYAGLQNQSWVDDLRFSVAGFNIKRNYNYGNTMDRAYGGVHSDMHSVVPTLKYQKSFWDGKLSIKQFLAYNKLNMSYTDTIKGLYNWSGEFTPIASRNGEASTGGSLMKLSLKNFTSRTNAQIRLLKNSKLTFNTVFNSIERNGSDPYGQKTPISKTDILNIPTIYRKWASTLGLETSWFGDKLNNEFLVKYFRLSTRGIDTYIAGTTENNVERVSNRWGVAEALKYSISDRLFMRTSAELTSRLPEQSEFFGDGAFILPNLQLQPEKSFNFNFGFNYRKPKIWGTEVNFFYRHTKDMIRIINTGFFNINKNTENVKGYGIEWDMLYHPFHFLTLNGNITYQNFRLFGQVDDTFVGSRLPNTPFFFTNLAANIHLNNVFTDGDHLKMYYLYNYVKSFYTAYVPKDMEPDGFLGLWGKPKVDISAVSIPDQNLHSFGCTYIPNSIWSVGIGVRNIFDSKIFDNFRIQNAGRSFNLKINYSLK